MLDVHPPHHTPSTWRDFLLHIATIVVGLLIAIGLEQSVEALHRRHLRHEALANIHSEIRDNRHILAEDVKAVASEKRMLEDDIATLRRLREHQPVPAHSLRFGWRFDAMEDAAWETARTTMAVSLFPTEQVQHFSGTYGQLGLVNEAGLALSKSLTSAMVPLTVEPDLAKMSPALVDELIRSCASSLNQIEYFEALTSTLDRDFQELLKEE